MSETEKMSKTGAVAFSQSIETRFRKGTKPDTITFSGNEDR